jgi:hypothetical protein
MVASALSAGPAPEVARACLAALGAQLRMPISVDFNNMPRVAREEPHASIHGVYRHDTPMNGISVDFNNMPRVAREEPHASIHGVYRHDTPIMAEYQRVS